MTVVDLFAGARGWCVGARTAGLEDTIGVELDQHAAATSRAAGFSTLVGDVAAMPLTPFRGSSGQTASPPCPTFSSAGSGSGRDEMPVLVEIAGLVAAGIPDGLSVRDWADADGSFGGSITDERTWLCLEPLRWALALRPTWIAWEQVPPVLPFWEACADHLRAAGYEVWTGLLQAERYGVPQTRVRAFLLAARDGRRVAPPSPTHQRYVPPRKHEGDGLFDVAALTERRVHVEDRDLLPWMSMAEALGWREGPSPRPSPTVSAGGTGSGGGVEVFASRDARRAASLAAVPPSHYDRRQVGGDGTPVGLRPVTEPAPTLGAEGLAKGRDRCVFERPATTVACDPRSARPGHHGTGQDGDAARSMTDAVRVTVDQAAALQSFPPGYPWQGPKTAQYRQIGNAVPPLLAQRVLESIAAPEIVATREGGGCMTAPASGRREGRP